MLPNLVRELRVMLHEAEDYVDNFIIKVYGQTGQDQKESIAEFGSELENINTRVSQIMNRRPQLGASPILEEIQQFLRSRFSFDEDDEETALASCMLNYINLPYDLQLSLLFCCAFPWRYRKTKGALVQVLVAAGLIQEKPGELMEDKAQENIERLVELGMLTEHQTEWDCLRVPSPYYKLSLSVMNAEDFLISTANSDSIIPPTARHVSIHDAENTITNMNSLLHSLFVSAKEGLSEASSDCLETVLYNAKRVRSKINELPESISNLRNLQTLDISWSGNEFELSNGVLNLAQLRHLKMFRPRNAGEVRVPRGISRLRNLQTLEGIYAGGGIAKELGNMAQLRSLEVRSVSEDHACELYASIMKLTGLCTLSLTVEGERVSYNSSSALQYENSLFPCLESFSPPPLLQKLTLTGHLIKMPAWGKRMEREFFRAGGFPKLEFLKVDSTVLVEWTEIEEGALPSLKQLCFFNCMKLMVLPEGLQHATTLQILDLWNVHEDLIRRLRPNGGPENYKIKHIPLVKYLGNMSSSGEFWRRKPPQ
ncbi:hypothetical protein PVL29_018686 [Vitis rotundifolia]|uniref:Disease resistance R13L4/SHOC-2-like LRR domain-containing protein n=1 Tax=Vitis rotundifolia TaxID=103349 RepID=A0AA39DGI7_VITRO|nr:hypothetical protein PVL29_018686 [Vitis rotundifolia]